jgi:hypothetical protein
MRRNLVFAEHNAEEVITIFFSIPTLFFFGESDNMLEHELEAAFLRYSNNACDISLDLHELRIQTSRSNSSAVLPRPSAGQT